MMQTRTYGGKYDGSLSTTQIAARFRADVKAAVKAGELPQGIKLSVRTEYFSMGSSIHAKVTALPEEIAMWDGESLLWQESRPSYDRTRADRSPEFARIMGTLEGMLQAYNHDGSDSMVDHFDVNFYGHVEVDYGLERARRERELAAASARASMNSAECVAVECFAHAVASLA